VTPERAAAEYETDHVLYEWVAVHAKGPYDWPPPDHYFYAALAAEMRCPE
jgi:hypothetical protein